MTPRPFKRWKMLTRLFRARASEIAAAEAETEAAMSEMRAERDRHLAAARRSLEATTENLRKLRARVPGAAHSQETTMRPALCIAVLALTLCSCRSIRDAAGDFSISLGTPLGTVTVESKLAKDTANAVLGPVVDPVTAAVGISETPVAK